MLEMLILKLWLVGCLMVWIVGLGLVCLMRLKFRIIGGFCGWLIVWYCGVWGLGIWC